MFLSPLGENGNFIKTVWKKVNYQVDGGAMRDRTFLLPFES